MSSLAAAMHLSQSWFRAGCRKTVLRLVESMREHWEHSAPWNFEDVDLSVFSITDLDDGGLAFLVWGSAKEPQVWQYSGQAEQRFEDVRSWLLWLVEA